MTINTNVLAHIEEFSSVNKNGRKEVTAPSMKILDAIFNTDFGNMGSIHYSTNVMDRGIEFFETEFNISSYVDLSDTDSIESFNSEYFRNIFNAIIEAQEDISLINFSIVIYPSSDGVSRHIKLGKDNKTVVVGNYGFPSSYHEISLFSNKSGE